MIVNVSNTSKTYKFTSIFPTQKFKKMGMLPIFCVYHKISRGVNLIFLY